MNSKQAAAIAALVIAGVALAGAILRLEPGGADRESAHHDDAPRAAAAAAEPGGKVPAAPLRTGEAAGPSTAGSPTANPSGARPPTAGPPTTSAPGQAATTAPARAPIPLSDEQLRAGGIVVEPAAPARLHAALTLPGEIRTNDDRTAHVVPRVAGVVESVAASLGEQVRRGQVLAVIASPAVSDRRSELAAAQRRLELARATFERERTLWQERISAEQDYLQARTALQEAEIAVDNARQKLDAIGVSADPAAGNRFELRAPFAGMVLEKHVALGEAVKDDANLFIISDLSTVWADFSVPAADLRAVRVGARATVRAPALDAEAAGTVSYVGSLIGEQTRTATARVTLPNPQGAWRPGLYVSVTLAAGERQAPVTVPSDAIQTVDGRPHVFVRVPGGFEPRPVEPGAASGARTEIARGLAAGEPVAAAGSFVVRSELEKGAGDAHD